MDGKNSNRNEWQLDPMPVRPQPALLRLYDQADPSHKLIGTTCFFRNRLLLRTILDQLDPSAKELTVLIHAASIGCDVYSFCIAYDLYFRGRHRPALRCYATDLSESFLSQARNAIYPLGVFRDLSDEERAYFEQISPNQCRVAEAIRKQVTILSATSYVQFTSDYQFDVVLLLNSLLYIPAEQQAMTLNKVAVYNRGLLVVTGFHTDSIRQDLSRNGYEPVTDRFEAIYNSWECRRSIPEGRMIEGVTHHTPAMEPLRECDDYHFRFGSLFKKTLTTPQPMLSVEQAGYVATPKLNRNGDFQVALFNDTGRVPHVGCRGVSLAHDLMLNQAGASVRHRFHVDEYRDLWKGNRADSLRAFWKSNLPTLLAEVDAVVVNGEGTIHHGAGLHLLTILAGAQEMGLPTFLVNAVFQECEQDLQTLRGLHDFTVRDAHSAAYLTRLGMPHRLVIDSIFAAPFHETALHDFRNKIVVTDWHASRANDVGAALENLLRESPNETIFYPLNHRDRTADWQHAVADFRQAKLVVSARHHGVCLAAMAGVPFVALGSNSWKIEGFLSQLPGQIRVCENLADLRACCDDALTRQSTFESIREFVHSQLPLSTFRGIEILAKARARSKSLAPVHTERLPEMSSGSQPASLPAPPQESFVSESSPQVIASQTDSSLRLFSQPKLSYVIFSSPKSGSTWLQRLLSSHPNVICAESRGFGDYFGQSATGSPHIPIQTYVRILSQYFSPTQNGLRPADDHFYRALLFNWLDTAAITARVATGRSIYGEKLTPYVGTARQVIELLAEYNPNIRFVNLTRDGRDVIVSGAAQWLNQRCQNGSEADRDNAARALREHHLRDDDFDLFLQNWMDSAQAGLDAKARFKHYFHLRYESLLNDPLTHVRQLFDFLNIPVTPEQLEACARSASFEQLSGGRKCGEENSQSFFRKGTAGDWKNWFQSKHEHRFNKSAATLMKQLGYPLTLTETSPVNISPAPQRKTFLQQRPTLPSPTDSNTLYRFILQECGKGSVLQLGRVPSELHDALIHNGVELKSAPSSSAITIDAEGAFDSILSIDHLDTLEENEVQQKIASLSRITRRFAFVQVGIYPQRPSGDCKIFRDRVWWERKFFEAGFRKHPLSQQIVSYETLENEGDRLILLFERIPQPALDRYPLTALKAERDLHMDMLREAGRRSDAHVARYQLAAHHVKAGDRVLDAACGLGYGSALIASQYPNAHVTGLDLSEYASDYAQTNFASVRSNLEFRTGDVCDLSAFGSESLDVVVSFETIEHIQNPEVFLAEVKRVLKPGGILVASVPNMWVDESGKDPNPWHFHVFDFPKLAALLQRDFSLKHAFRQNAGGGMKCSRARRELLEVNLPVTSGHDQTEWWLAIAQKNPFTKPVASASKKPAKVVVFAPNTNHPLYQSWIPHCPQPVATVNSYDRNWEPPNDTALLVTHDTYTEPGMTIIRRAINRGIPTLILADGILEYRNTWEHPQLTPGAMLQPVLGHKIACIGRSQARILESWGNAGKCEIVGAPRLDRYHGLQRRERKAHEPVRILITTALTPYFTNDQHQRVSDSLRDLKNFFSSKPTIDGIQIEPVWRLTKNLEQEIGVHSQTTDFTGLELAEALQKVDAVISTPSTAMLEAMLLGLPVALLDYCNTPHYVPAAWRITSTQQIGEVVSEMLNPPAPKLLFQETVLHDSLECASPATPRLLQLIEQMIAHGEEQRSTRPRLVLPDRILRRFESAPKENRFHVESLFASAVKPEHASIRTLSSESHSPSKVKILFVGHDASRTGAPVFLLNFLRWLRQSSTVEFRIVLRAGGPLEAAFRELGETHILKDIQPGSALLDKVELVYSNTCTNGLFLNSISRSGIPIVTHVHELNDVMKLYGDENLAAVKNQTTHYIACSEAVAANLRSRHNIPEQMISVHHEGIPVSLVQTRAQTSVADRAALGLAADSFVIAACGLADWRKGPDLFLQLADSLRRKVGAKRKVEFVWIGLVPPDERGRLLRSDLDRLELGSTVRFVGELENPYPWLNACDVFCLPSREDPFPLVMLEAAALGKPVLCFARSGGAEEFCRLGAGFAAPYLDVESLRQQCVALMENPTLLRETGEAAARVARENFDIEKIGSKLLRTVDSVAKQQANSENPNSPRLQQIWAEANAAIQKNDFDCARILLMEAQSLAPRDREIVFQLGSVETQLEHWDEALACWRRVAELNPQDPILHLNQAFVFVQKDQIHEASTAARRALDLDPKHLDALRLLAGLAEHQAQYTEASDLYSRIGRLVKEDRDSLLGQARCSLRLGHAVLAGLLYEQVLNVDPANAEAKIGLASVEKLEESAKKLSRPTAPVTEIPPRQNQPTGFSGQTESNTSMKTSPFVLTFDNTTSVAATAVAQPPATKNGNGNQPVAQPAVVAPTAAVVTAPVAQEESRFASFRFHSPLKPRQTYPQIKQLKIDLIAGFGRAESIRDFGGLWGVHGLYLLEGAKALQCRYAEMVDVTPRPEFDQKIAELVTPLDVRMTQGDFRDARLFYPMNPVEVALLYEVLLHQDNAVEVIKNVISKTTRCLCIAQPVMKEELFALPNGVVNLQFYPEELKDQLRYSGWWEKEPATDRFTTTSWMWGQTTSWLVSVLHGYGWEPAYLETYEASEFWNYAMIRFEPRSRK